MRIAALLLGLAAGLFALLAPVALQTDLLTPFMALWSGSASEAMVGRILWYAMPALAVFGAILATFAPSMAMLPLGIAAVGWVGISLSVPELFDFRLLGPAVAAGLAAVLALTSAELAARRRRTARRKQRSLSEIEENADEIEREAALRMAPLVMPREDAVAQRATRVVELDLDDVTTITPASPPPRWQDIDAEVRRRPRDIWGEAIRPDREEPIQPAEPAEIIEPEPEPDIDPIPAQRGFRWDRADAPMAEKFSINPAAGPRLVEARRAPDRPASPPPPPAASQARATAAEALRPLSVSSEPLWPELEQEEPVRAEPQQQQQQLERRRGGSALMAALMAVVAVLLLAVVSVGGYLAYRDGWLDRVVALVAPADSTPTGATPQPAPPAIAELPSPQPVVLPEAVSPEASPALASLPRLPAPAETAPATYSDPFAYCGAVGTLDYVDQRYIGPAVTEDMTSALQLPAVATRDRVHWRCSGGKVLACASYIGPICDMVPTSEEMTAFCARYPNAAQLMAPGGVWSCVAGSPQLPPEARWPVDARGFRADSWHEVKPVAMPAG